MLPFFLSSLPAVLQFLVYNFPDYKSVGCGYFQAATAIIKESVEPLLEEYRPPGITSLKFSKLSLGNVPPKIEGINHM